MPDKNYIHYFEQTERLSKDEWHNLVQFSETLFDKLKADDYDITLAASHGASSPVINSKRISFNGLSKLNEMGDSFELRFNDEAHQSSIKTNKQPYDIAVIGILSHLAKKHPKKFRFSTTAKRDDLFVGESLARIIEFRMQAN